MDVSQADITTLYLDCNDMVGQTYSLRVFQNRVLQRIFGSTGQKETGRCRKLHNEDLHNLYTSSNNVRMITSRGLTCSMHER
jgi:hypothetical protein